VLTQPANPRENCPKNLSVDRAPCEEGRTDRQPSCWHRSNQGRQNGAPDSLRTGLADPPEDWSASSPCDAAAVITLEPKSRLARFWLVIVKHSAPIVHVCVGQLVIVVQ